MFSNVANMNKDKLLVNQPPVTEDEHTEAESQETIADRLKSRKAAAAGKQPEGPSGDADVERPESDREGRETRNRTPYQTPRGLSPPDSERDRTLKKLMGDLPDLQRISGPLKGLTVDEGASLAISFQRVFQTCRESKDVIKVKDILARRNTALSLAGRYLGRRFDPNQEPLERTARHKFKQLMPEIHSVTQGITCKFLGGSEVGRTCGEVYDLFQDKLHKLYRDLYNKGFDLNIYVPQWGLHRADCARYWPENDFEILSVAFRYDVEAYLNYIGQYYTWEGDKVVPCEFGVKRESELEDDLNSPLTQKALRNEKKVVKDPPPHFSNVAPEDNINVSSVSALGFKKIRKDQADNFMSKKSEGSGNPFFQSPTSFSNTRRMDELFGSDKRKGNSSSNPRIKSGNPDDDPDSSSDDDDHPKKRNDRKDPKGNSSRRKDDNFESNNQTTEVARFDLKIKPDEIPTWDADEDTLGTWILKINALARRSSKVKKQLGQLVPTRLRKGAEFWYYSLPDEFRVNAEKDWETVRDAIGSYYMNRSWLERQKSRANRAAYRDSSNHSETPAEYYIRKSQLLNLVYTMSDSEIIMEVMNSAPTNWSTILTPHLYSNVVEFQAALKYHEDILMKMSSENKRSEQYSDFSRSKPYDRQKSNFYKKSKPTKVNAKLVGWHKSLPSPKYPPDDSNVSPGTTPEDKGGRGCRHCGSRKHWDNHCKYAREEGRNAKARLATVEDNDNQAEQEYDNLYQESLDNSSAGEPESSEDSENHSSEPEAPVRNVSARGGWARLGGSNQAPATAKPLNPFVRDKLHARNFHIPRLISLKKWMSRPPGTAFLGANAMQTKGYLNHYQENEAEITIDTGSDITLISESTWKEMNSPPKLRNGEKVNLIQVTGSTSISGYIQLPVYIETNRGPVEIHVEAYVVKGMTTPFILGNDFADQYSISIIREEDRAYLKFGETGRITPIENSIGPTLLDTNGNKFNINCRIAKFNGLAWNQRAHRREQKHRKRVKNAKLDNSVRSKFRTIIPPETCKAIWVKANFGKFPNSLYVEKVINFRTNPEDAFGCPDSLILKECPFLHVSNFSKVPLVIEEGEILGTARKTENWLDQRYLDPKQEACAKVVKTIVQRMLEDKRDSNHTQEQLIEVVEGGPKTAEVPPDEVTHQEDLFKEVHLSEHLTPDQRQAIEKVVWKNRTAFSLEGRLGEYEDTFVEIPIKENSKPISLPPFKIMSPKSRKIMDDQMDLWINLEVIEPSKSPWGAPGFIAYRNGKPRMVIDYRKLNELVIPDEFPLPRQDDILQALTGSQWLSTLDALAGFTQLKIAEGDKEKTAFRTHRGLYQFKRMPFGFRNGPACFQRVMQNILAPFLWIFALVYIDDIVIYSRTFEEHVEHLDKVFNAIAESKITLSPKKCHLGFRSLQLLGQKVSRLGLSTHREKVEAIIQLEEPRNVKELQTFLGMMVYFASYIPFYAWIVAPLFKLLKKTQAWEWGKDQQEAFELAKQVLTNAPVRAYAIPGKPFRIYSDACDYGIAAILQQVQPIQIKDLKGTKIYDKLKKAYEKGDKVPRLVVTIGKEDTDVPQPGNWSENFEDTEVHIERVIAYWSRSLKSAEQNYSPTEREALALRDGLVKFQAYLEGETFLAITDHAALTWSRTFQNVNKRLLTWGTIFAAYPDMKIVHRAGRVHSNVDPISRLRRRVPMQEGPSTDETRPAPFNEEEISDDLPLRDMYEEIAPDFEAKILHIARQATVNRDKGVNAKRAYLVKGFAARTKGNSSAVITVKADDCLEYIEGYKKDTHFSKILASLLEETDEELTPSRYFLGEDNLIYFENWQGSPRLCVPANKRRDVMIDAHESITEAAHSGYEKTYNRIAASYYWPKMSQELKEFVSTCDICQKSKPRRHAPYGKLQPIAIPERPFEVISMDFITELPESNGYDTVLVVVDKLTKYASFILTKSTAGEIETADLIFKHIVSEYGLPEQFITDRDARWTGEFWKSVCKSLGIKRNLTTAHHPQADGQTEIMNQNLEIALRAYVGNDRDDWSEYLDALKLAYNTSKHSSTKFAPAYLLRGYQPRTGLNLNAPLDADILDRGDKEAEWLEKFDANLEQAKNSLALAQTFQQKYYNEGRLNLEFEEGDLVLINPHSLELLKNIKGRGKKLLMKYDGPFEILQKVSPLAYRLRMPESYKMHPVINIAHLEKYQKSPEKFGERQTKHLNRLDFKDLPEFEVDKIISERTRKVNKRNRKEYKVRFSGYGEEYDEWLTKRQLKNAPEVMEKWNKRKERIAANDLSGLTTEEASPEPVNPAKLKRERPLPINLSGLTTELATPEAIEMNDEAKELTDVGAEANLGSSIDQVEPSIRDRQGEEPTSKPRRSTREKYQAAR